MHFHAAYKLILNMNLFLKIKTWSSDWKENHLAHKTVHIYQLVSMEHTKALATDTWRHTHQISQENSFYQNRKLVENYCWSKLIVPYFCIEYKKYKKSLNAISSFNIVTYKNTFIGFRFFIARLVIVS